MTAKAITTITITEPTVAFCREAADRIQAAHAEREQPTFSDDELVLLMRILRSWSPPPPSASDRRFDEALRRAAVVEFYRERVRYWSEKAVPDPKTRAATDTGQQFGISDQRVQEIVAAQGSG